MNQIQQNIETYQAAIKIVKDHPMCAGIEDALGKLIIEYPAGDFPVQGLRIDRNAVMIGRAVEIMERHWAESFPGYLPAMEN